MAFRGTQLLSRRAFPPQRRSKDSRYFGQRNWPVEPLEQVPDREIHHPLGQVKPGILF
jgi:hypothetical protein